MELSYKIENDICILSINGNLSQDVVLQFEKYTLEIMQDHTLQGLILNFQNVGWICSSGYSELLAIKTELENRKIAFLLCQLNPDIQLIIKETGLHKLFQIRGTEDEALTTLASPSI